MSQQLTNDILNAALENLTGKRQQIDAQITEIRRLIGNSSQGASTEPATPGPKRKMSAAGRRAIAAAQKRRWAVAKGSEPAQTAEASKPKRKLSAAGRRNIVAALKKRWAAKRGEAGTESAPKKSPTNRVARKVAKGASAAVAGGASK